MLNLYEDENHKEKMFARRRYEQREERDFRFVLFSFARTNT